MSAGVSFEYQTESIRTAALTLEYFLVPWDTKIFGVPVAQIADLRVLEPTQAARDYERFLAWCTEKQIAFCACRVPAERLADSMFLEERGFRFVELNYLPQLTGLQQLRTSDEGIEVAPAQDGDRAALKDIATHTFRHGRFHQDPRIDPRLGDRRYGVWLDNAFVSSTQRVLKCSFDGELVGFFVVEQREQGHCYWSLNGLAPGREGRGLGQARVALDAALAPRRGRAHRQHEHLLPQRTGAQSVRDARVPLSCADHHAAVVPRWAASLTQA